MNSEWHDDVGADTSGADDREERRWQRRAEIADEARRSAELDRRVDLLPFALREASRAVDDVLRNLVRHSELASLSMTSLHVLVLARGTQPIVSMAHRMRVTPQAIGRHVKELAVHGLVETSVSPMDSRARLVSLTEDGEELLRHLRKQMFVAVTVVSDAVGEERLVALVEELADLALVDVGPRTSW